MYGLKFVTDDPDWGTGEGHPLVAAEVDRNFFTLGTKVNDLQENPPQAISISNIVVIGSQFTIYLTDGNSYGPFTLPIAIFKWRSEWAPTTVYLMNDIFTVKGQGLFMALLDHTSGATFDPDATDGDGNPLYSKMFGEDTYIYTFGFFYPGTPGAGVGPSEMMVSHLFAEDVYLPQGTTSGLAKLQVAPTANVAFEMWKNGDIIGSLTFAAGETTGEVTVDADTQFVAGDVFAFYSDSTTDATAKNLNITMKGLRGDIPS